MADSKKMKSVKIHTLEDTFVELSVAKTATTQEVIEMVFQKMNMRDETAGFTLAERTRKTGELERVLVDEEWPAATLKVRDKKKKKNSEAASELVLVPKDIDLLAHNEHVRETRVDEAVPYSGWLVKRGAKRESWKRRWCVIQEQTLYYYEDTPVEEGSVVGKNLKGEVDLRGSFVVPCNSVGKENAFCVCHTSHQRDFYFQAGNELEVADWINAVREATFMAAPNEPTDMMQAFVWLRRQAGLDGGAGAFATMGGGGSGGGGSSSGGGEGGSGADASQLEAENSELREEVAELRELLLESRRELDAAHAQLSQS